MYWLGTVAMFTTGSCCLPVAFLFSERNKPHSFAFSAVPTAQKLRASMTCSGDFRISERFSTQSVRGQPGLRDGTEDFCMAQILKGLINHITDLGFFFSFLVSYFNQRIGCGQVFGLRTISLVAL